MRYVRSLSTSVAIMYATKNMRYPVVTLLSPSPLASQKAQELLHNMIGLDSVDISLPVDDELNATFRSSLPGFSRQWHSLASQCPSSGSVFHFCSMEGNNTRQGPLSLIGLTDSAGTVRESVQNVRTLLSQVLQNRTTAIILNESVGNLISPMALLKSVSIGGLPMLHLPSVEDTENENFVGGDTDHPAGLKEIVVPYFDYAKFRDGSSLLSRISEASLERPAVGVYRWTNSTTHVRPLPTCGEDTRLPPPSFIFGCQDLAVILEKEQKGLKVAKIGYSGNRKGQLMLFHEDIMGIDIRLCSESQVSSAFCEAQESLMAASLEELQSPNALLGDGLEGKHDERLGQGDCWVEVRANLKRPSGFFHRSGGLAPSKHRVAKIPDIPYE
jgi:hypothetical protein